ncbi:hypothetical protein C8A03DRAFT_16393 [Achaetomium macrosporum]|uniref:E3 ubiquitin ligase complex SCF subunit n=1 Tax=Achaetomium macrosporum TaxID=79813 RepID=A0AAN7C849_9PEZI|nr:hypothetical protein C8A03DRAFT_16393 [Achaetomium macrosporum]
MAANQTLRLQNMLNPESRVFEVDRVAAEHSTVIRTILEHFDESYLAENAIPILIDVSDDALAKVCEWVTHWKDLPKAADVVADYSKQGGTHGTANKAEETEEEGTENDVIDSPWNVVFFSGVDAKMLYEILITANYLDIKPLCNLCCEFIATIIRDKPIEEVCNILCIDMEFTITPEQGAAIRDKIIRDYYR